MNPSRLAVALPLLAVLSFPALATAADDSTPPPSRRPRRRSRSSRRPTRRSTSSSRSRRAGRSSPRSRRAPSASAAPAARACSSRRGARRSARPRSPRSPSASHSAARSSPRSSSSRTTSRSPSFKGGDFALAAQVSAVAAASGAAADRQVQPGRGRLHRRHRRAHVRGQRGRPEVRLRALRREEEVAVRLGAALLLAALLAAPLAARPSRAPSPRRPPRRRSRVPAAPTAWRRSTTAASASRGTASRTRTPGASSTGSAWPARRREPRPPSCSCPPSSPPSATTRPWGRSSASPGRSGCTWGPPRPRPSPACRGWRSTPR